MSVGQSKAIRARQGKMNRMIDKAKKVVDDRNLFGSSIKDLINSRPLPDMIFPLEGPIKPLGDLPGHFFTGEPRITEVDILIGSYTTTVQLDEPEPISKLTEAQVQAISDWWGEYMRSEFERMIAGHGVSEQALMTTTKIEPPEPKRGKSAFLSDVLT